MDFFNMNNSLGLYVNKCNQTQNFSQLISSPSMIISFGVASSINLWMFGSCLFVIIILSTSKNKRFDATRKFLINLAVNDIGFAVFLMPISISYIILKVNWIPCHIICHLWIISDVYFGSTNMFNLAVIALDRMMAVNYAVRYNQMMSNTRVRLLILLIWILALLITTPLFVSLLWSQTTASQLSEESVYPCYYGNKCSHYPCSLINVSVYIRIFIVIGSIYVPTVLICYFYFHVFSKVVVNKRGISIGLLIDNERVNHKKNNKKVSSPKVSVSKNNNNENKNSDDQENGNNNNDNNNSSDNDKTNKTNTKSSNYGLLRVHVGGKPFNMNLHTTTPNMNYRHSSSTNINNTNDNDLQQETNWKNNKNYGSSIIINSSTNKSPEKQPKLCLTTGLVKKERHESDCGTSTHRCNDPFISDLVKTNYKSKMSKKSSSTPSEMVFKVNKCKTEENISKQQQQQYLKIKIKNILRKHSFHNLSSDKNLKPIDLMQSRRSTGKNDKDAKFTDLSTLRRCALMPLHGSAACSSISNEYTYSTRNSENISNLSATYITPRNSNPIDQSILSSEVPLTSGSNNNPINFSSYGSDHIYGFKIKHTIEIKAICMFLINISSIILCWLPFYTLILFTDIMPDVCLSFTIYDFFYWSRFLCIAFNPIIYGSASEDLRKAFKRFILHCGKVKKEKKALKRLVLAGLGAAGIPYGHRIIIPPQRCNSGNSSTNNKSVILNKPLMILTDTEEKV
ncbi:unnamed protein product [Heterobilharzia americana]|nr:unnamed protein product [Heterobilharzia americana]